MCTAIFDNKFGAFFGRTLDLECSLGEHTARVERGEVLRFIHEGERTCKYSIIGMAHVANTANGLRSTPSSPATRELLPEEKPDFVISAHERMDCKSIPLFYDAINEQGLCAAALNFPNFAKYNEKDLKKRNLASFEVILYLLSQFKSVKEAVSFLEGANITSDAFSPALPPTPLHWMICDRDRAAVLEQTEDGLRIFENEVGVMTNSPPFPYHVTRLCDYSLLSPTPPENNILPSQELSPYSRGLGAFGLPGDYSSSSRFVRAVFAKEHTLLPPCEDDTRREAARRRLGDILGTVSLPYGIARTEKGEPIYTVYTSFMDMERCEYSYFTYDDRGVKVFKF